MRSVKFLRSHLMYQPGEVAGFDARTAEDLIARGVAVDPNSKGATQAATSDVLVNPVDAFGDDAVELQTRLQAQTEAPVAKAETPAAKSKPAAKKG